MDLHACISYTNIHTRAHTHTQTNTHASARTHTHISTRTRTFTLTHSFSLIHTHKHKTPHKHTQWLERDGTEYHPSTAREGTLEEFIPLHTTQGFEATHEEALADLLNETHTRHHGMGKHTNMPDTRKNGSTEIDWDTFNFTTCVTHAHVHLQTCKYFLSHTHVHTHTLEHTHTFKLAQASP